MKIDRNSPIPLHKQAETLLRELITEEEYKINNRGGVQRRENVAQRSGII